MRRRCPEGVLTGPCPPKLARVEVAPTLSPRKIGAFYRGHLDCAAEPQPALRPRTRSRGPDSEKVTGSESVGSAAAGDSLGGCAGRGGRRVRHGVRTSLDVLGMTENQALRIENGYHLAPAYLLAITRSCRSAGGPWTNPELQRPPRRRRMASTRPPGTYSPSARTGRRGGGSGTAWSGARALTRCRCLCAQRPRLAVWRPASAAGTGRTQRSGFRGCFDMRNPLQHNPGPRGPGRTDGDRDRRGRRRRDPGGRRRLRGAH